MNGLDVLVAASQEDARAAIDRYAYPLDTRVLLMDGRRSHDGLRVRSVTCTWFALNCAGSRLVLQDLRRSFLLGNPGHRFELTVIW